MNNDINAALLESDHDDLKRLAIEEIAKRRRFDRTLSCLVLPAGQGELAVELGKYGPQICAVDESVFAQHSRNRALAAGFSDNFHFASGTLTDLPDVLPEQPFDLIFIRRGLSDMPYPQARSVIRKLLQRLKIGGKIYVSILGIYSELGDGYRGEEDFIEERFAPVCPNMAKKYGITGPVCLYSERNLFTLLLEAGGSVLRTFTSTHGIVKGVAVRV